MEPLKIDEQNSLSKKTPNLLVSINNPIYQIIIIMFTRELSRSSQLHSGAGTTFSCPMSWEVSEPSLSVMYCQVLFLSDILKMKIEINGVRSLQKKSNIPADFPPMYNSFQGMGIASPGWVEMHPTIQVLKGAFHQQDSIIN